MSTLLHNKDGKKAHTDRTEMQTSDIVSSATAAAASISMSANSSSFDTGRKISFYKIKNKQDNQIGNENDAWDMVDNSYDVSNAVDIDTLLDIPITEHSNNHNNKKMNKTISDEMNINEDFINIDTKGRMTADSLESDPRDGRMLIDNALLQGSSRASNLKKSHNDIQLQDNYLRSPDRISSPGDPVYDVKVSDMYEVMNIPPSPTSIDDTHTNSNSESLTIVNKSRRSESSDYGKDDYIQRYDNNDDKNNNRDGDHYVSRKEIERNNNNSDEITALLKKLTYQLFGKTGDIIFMFIMESFCPKEHSMSYFLISHTLAMFLGAFIGRKVSKLSFPSSKMAYNIGTASVTTTRMGYNSININNMNNSRYGNDQESFNDDPVSTM